MNRTRTQAVSEPLAAVRNGMLVKPSIIVKGNTFVLSSKVRIADER